MSLSKKYHNSSGVAGGGGKREERERERKRKGAGEGCVHAAEGAGG